MEKIFVIKTEYLRPYLKKTALFTEGLEGIERLAAERGEFLPRDKAENDPSYKQLIPYISICRGDRFFATRRLAGGGESRLHGLLSLGVGGHINPCDGEHPLRAGMLRELREEVLMSDYGDPTPRGLINDDGNDVGSVHLGYFCTLETDCEVSIRETEKLEGFWMTADELRAARERMETWSGIILPYLLGEVSL